MKSDAQLRADIQAELASDPAVSGAEVGVIVDHGVVTLTGHVGSHAEKVAVQRAVQRVGGVRALAVETPVKLAAGMERTDADIAQAIVRTLGWNAQVPRGAIKPTVEGGWVTLVGAVEWDCQREAAESAVRNLLGVTGITNLVRIRTQRRSADVERQIEEALVRAFHGRPHQVGVDVDDSQIVLRGKVHSWREFDDVRRAVWSAPGVDSVINELAVEA